MKIEDIVKICNGELLSGNKETKVNFFSKDTRTIKYNDAYIGIRGEKYDGNLYIKDAFDKGACACIIDNKDIDLSSFSHKTIVYVQNTITALCDLARYKRDNFEGKVIGITGSVGKTTTKDIVSSILETKYDVLKTEGSFNNNIGLPLCILNKDKSEVWVIEMGMNNLGEISYLSKIVRPHLSIITNVGTSHIGMLKSRENILKAKLEILDGMSNGTLIINNDNDLLHNYYLNNKDGIVTVGIINESDYQTNKIKENAVVLNNKDKLKLFSCEKELIIDSLFGYVIGKMFDIDNRNIRRVLFEFKQQGSRLKEEKSNLGFTLINDSFNASYDSMILAINHLSKFDNRKILVLGDMLELGKYSKKIHKDLGKIISKSNIDVLLTVGVHSKYIMESALKNGYDGIVKHFKNNGLCELFIKEFINKNDVILFKASKKMNFIEMCDRIKEI